MFNESSGPGRERVSRSSARRADERLGLSIYPGSEDLATAGEDLVQRFLEVRCAVGDVLPDLVGVLLPALPDLFLEQLLEIPVAELVLALGGMVHDHVRDERPREPARLERRVLGQEGVHGSTARSRRRTRQCWG